MSYNPPKGPPPGHEGPFDDQNGQNYQQNNYQDYENQYQETDYPEKPKELENFDESFKVEKPRFNDWPFALFFLLTFAGLFVVAGICLHALKLTWHFQGGSIYDSGNQFTLNTNTIVMFAFVVVISVVLSALVIVYARLAARLFITTGLILNVVLGIGTAIYYFCAHYWSAAVVFLVFSLITAWCYWSARLRIPFSATVLEITIDVMKLYPLTMITSFCGIIISGAFSAFFSIVIVGVYVKYNPDENNEACSLSGGGCSKSKVIGLLVFVFFAGYWISEVIKNVIHVTIAGIFGVWYYLALLDQGAPKHPALGALKRALTYCFGSICFGSLVVALLELLRAFINVLKLNAFGNDDICAGCGFLILDLFLSFIEWCFRYFNHYSYVYVGLYGKSYLKSARETVDLLRFKGMDALINDCFINTSLNLYSLFVGYITALFTFFYLKFTKPGYNKGGGYYAPMLAFSFLIAGQVTRITLVVIESGILTFFVALAKDPEIFQMTNRDRFDEIFRNYPQVLEKLTADH